ncbi:16674_t:CDS:2 [Acaulospora morrowiae]|uniref:16674_t:CDS:1 n=1 Tax=Acaulospora morrowiae TaxID=94023 RepID=A0A9N9I215_9GLOM|nr:16674_t:CDS:2 [Acaulospora morrowiae]
MSSAAAQLQRRVHSFWFRGYTKGTRIELSLIKLWFNVNEAFDNECRSSFGQDLEDIIKNGSHIEELKKTPEGTLSLTILLDQLPRNIYRGTARPFLEFDPLALDTCKYALGLKWDEMLDPVERAFMYLPLEHSENMQNQILCVERMKWNRDNSPPIYAEYCKGALQASEEHKAIIERFGRYPHRNKCLGRENTKEELDYLTNGAQNYGQ